MVLKYLAAVDIGGTKITVSISGKDSILFKVFELSKKQGNNKTIPNQVDDLISYCCNKINIKKSQISAVGISTCTPFKKIGKKIFICPTNLCGGVAEKRKNGPKNNWKFIPLQQELSKKYRNIKIENDGKSSAIAEHLFGSAKNEDNFVYVTWSTGIGGGAFVDGNLLDGKNKNASHIGHIFLSQEGPQCGCGNFGDLESLASGSSVSRDYNNKHPKEIFGLYGKGDKKAKNIIEKAAKNFAKGLSSINAMLDTKLFILGGSMMKSHKVLLPLIRKEFYTTFPSMTFDVEIKLSNLHESLGDLSALSLVMPDSWVKKWQRTKPWLKHHKTDIL